MQAVSWGGTGRYRRIAELARGGMATVFLTALEGPHGFQKLVVTKEMRGEIAGDPEFRRMFIEEARVAARLNHPNVVQTLEVVEADGTFAIVMEYLDGQTLGKLRQATRGHDLLPLHLYVAANVLAGLEHVHAGGIVHRDVSPQNVFVTYEGDVKLLDFGIVKTADAVVHTAAGTLKGKVGYMAPEQLVGRPVDARTDLFAVGVLLWEAVTGTRLWAKLPEATVLLRLVSGEIPTVLSVKPDAPPELDALCARAMAVNPDDRFRSAAEFLSALEEIIARVAERASRKELARYMATIFAEPRQAARERLDEILARGTSSPSLGLLLAGGSAVSGSVPAVVASSVTRRERLSADSIPLPIPTSPAPQNGAESGARRRPSRGLFHAASLLLVLLATAGATLAILGVQHRSELPAPGARPPAASGLPEPAVAASSSSETPAVTVAVAPDPSTSSSAPPAHADSAAPPARSIAPPWAGRGVRRVTTGASAAVPGAPSTKASAGAPARSTDTNDIDLGY